MRVRPFWAIGLYLLLVVSAGLALWAQRSPAGAEVNQWAPWVFLTFAVGFSSYRLALVMAGRYSAFKAFMQIFFAALFFMLLLLPGVKNTGVPGGPATPSVGNLAALLSHRDPLVRALAAEAGAARRDLTVASQVVGLLSDADPEVRSAAHRALVSYNNGIDLGRPPGEAVLKAWRERFP